MRCHPQSARLLGRRHLSGAGDRGRSGSAGTTSSAPARGWGRAISRPCSARSSRSSASSRSAARSSAPAKPIARVRLAAAGPGARRGRAVRPAAADRVGVLVALPCLIVVGALASRNSRLDATSIAALSARRVLRHGLRQRARRADAAARHLVRRVGAHGHARQSCARLPDGDEPVEPALLPDRRVPRHRGRRAARHRPDRHHRDAAADHVRPAAGLGADHAVGHLLRRAVRRLDHRDPDQPAGRIRLGGDRARRLPDGAPGQGRAWRSRPPRSARSSPAPSRPCWSRCSRRRSPRSR